MARCLAVLCESSGCWWKLMCILEYLVIHLFQTKQIVYLAVIGVHSTQKFFHRVGEHITSTTSDGQHTDISVERIISHPMYSRSAINNDIALIKLSSPIKFGKYVKPVCIPKQGGNVPIGTQCFITGKLVHFHLL